VDPQAVVCHLEVAHQVVMDPQAPAHLPIHQAWVLPNPQDLVVHLVAPLQAQTHLHRQLVVVALAVTQPVIQAQGYRQAAPA